MTNNSNITNMVKGSLSAGDVLHKYSHNDFEMHDVHFCSYNNMNGTKDKSVSLLINLSMKKIQVHFNDTLWKQNPREALLAIARSNNLVQSLIREYKFSII